MVAQDNRLFLEGLGFQAQDSAMVAQDNRLLEGLGFGRANGRKIDGTVERDR
jgi:hypothetical protein